METGQRQIASQVGVEEFGPVAEFYDELMKGVPYRMWVGYYLLLLAKQDFKPQRILEVCCGTGTMCELLTEEGKQMEGFDLSAPMIVQAREKAKHRLMDIRYEVMDAATFDMGKTYEAAFAFFDSLNYITDPDKLQMAMHRVSEHLEPGGSWIFDLNTAYAFEEEMFTQKKLSPKAKIRYDWKGRWDPESRIIEVDMKFWKGEVEYHEKHVQRAYEEHEIRDMLKAAGFQDIEVFNSYTLEPARKRSDRIHIACRKAPA